ncbi:MAG: hypothetical protein ACYC0V_15350 [Armatimonadota bacterium]
MVNPIKSGIYTQILKAIKQLNPSETDAQGKRRFTIALAGNSSEEVDMLRSVFLGVSPSEDEIRISASVLKRCEFLLDEVSAESLKKAEIILVYPGVDIHTEAYKGDMYLFDPEKPDNALKSIIASGAGSELKLAIGARFPALRTEISRGVLREVSRENAVFAITTALGNVAPSIIQPFLGVAEAAGDMVILTSNQIRMMFMIGAVYGSEIGFKTQWKEVTSIIGAAFGWRAIARELVAKIPFGGGLAPKGAIAYAGTTAIGEGLIFFYTNGRHMTRKETAEAFKKAYSDAVGVVRSLLERFRPSLPAAGDVVEPPDKSGKGSA